MWFDSRSSSFRSRFEHDRDVLLAGTTVTAPPGDRGRSCAAASTHADLPSAHGRRGTSACAQPAPDVQGADAQRSHRRVDAGHRDAVRIVRPAGAPVLHEGQSRGHPRRYLPPLRGWRRHLVMAPAAVLDLPFTFETLGTASVRATYQNAGFTVSAVVTFNSDGDLVGFVSDDRSHDRDEGPATWSTPISGYREIDGIRVGTHGDANWIDASGEWTYGRFEVTSLAYNVRETP